MLLTGVMAGHIQKPGPTNEDHWACCLPGWRVRCPRGSATFLFAGCHIQKTDPKLENNGPAAYQGGTHGDVVAAGDHHAQKAVNEPPSIWRKSLDEVTEVLCQARLERFVGDGQVGEQLLRQGLNTHARAIVSSSAVALLS